MTLRVFTPDKTHDMHEIVAIDVETTGGHRTFLPRHVDSTVALAPGLLLFRSSEGEDRYMGVDGGTLVKIGQRVMVSTPRVALEEELGALRESLEKRRRAQEERHREARWALARLEVEFARSLFHAEAGQ